MIRQAVDCRKEGQNLGWTFSVARFVLLEVEVWVAVVVGCWMVDTILYMRFRIKEAGSTSPSSRRLFFVVSTV